jgi:ribonuclease BN (tRNA processing enzyme)
MIFITHIHGDHQLGVIKIMYERDKILKSMGAEALSN